VSKEPEEQGQWGSIVRLPAAMRAAIPASVVLLVTLSLGWTAAGVVVVEMAPGIAAAVWPRDWMLVLGTTARFALVAALVLWLGRLRLADVGIVWNQIPAGLLLSGLIWAGAQVAGLATSGLGRGALALHPDWQNPGALLGPLARQVLAVGLVEEVIFRGYLLPQTYLAVARRWPDARRWHWPIALALSQGLFAVMHLPFLRYAGLPWLEVLIGLPVIFLYGMLFAGLYLLTGNLFLAVGVHGLATAPTPIFAGTDVGAAVGITEAALALLAVASVVREWQAWRRPKRVGVQADF
jgi:hypothetical protein